MLVEDPIEFPYLDVASRDDLIPRPDKSALDELAGPSPVTNAVDAVREEGIDVRIEEIQKFLLFDHFSHRLASYDRGFSKNQHNM